MYQIEDENTSIVRYINYNNIYRIHPTSYIGFNDHQLYRQYRDSMWVYASEYIENIENIENKDFQNQTFIIKSDENYKHKSFFIIKKSNLIQDGYKIWDCMVYIIKNTDNIELPQIISSSNILLGY